MDNLCLYESELVEIHSQCLKVNKLLSHQNPDIPDYENGVYQSFPRPYIIGKSMD